jgi:CxxC motif-containing protein (DUF1111 family)
MAAGLGSVIWLGAAGLIGLSAQSGSCAAPAGQAASVQVVLGESVFNTEWAPASAPGVARRGLGPLFNAASCAACHPNGGHGEGPAGNGSAPAALVVQLQTPGPDLAAEADGDPVYGRVFNTRAVNGAQAEGVVTISYREIEGRYYPDGMRWRMRVPHYRLTGLTHGPLAAQTMIKPRLAPPLFGVALLEAVPASAIDVAATARDANPLRSAPMRGRFGWQGDSASIRDQTAKAFAREMGLATIDTPHDDCTAAEADCLRRPDSGVPEVSGELLEAVVGYVRTLVSAPPVRTEQGAGGTALFASLGCAACHRPELPVVLTDASGTQTAATIAPYTDLRLHDLGIEMADETASGEKVTSRWRTASLWGLGHRIRTETHPTFLHDGRARSPEEAILWHAGEAAQARRNFVNLWGRPREMLLRWLETL